MVLPRPSFGVLHVLLLFFSGVKCCMVLPMARCSVLHGFACCTESCSVEKVFV